MESGSSSVTGLAALIFPLLELFRDVNIAVGLAGAIALAGVFVLVWFSLVQMIPALRQVRRVTRVVAETTGPSGFAAGFDDIDVVFASTPLFRHGWSKLRQTLILPPQGSSEPVRYSAPLGQMVNLSAMEAAGLNLRLYQAIPNYFVGLGLIFTFMGLVAALFFAARGVGAADVKVAQQALGNLLQAATFKFMTSIAGLGSSLMLAVTYRLWVLRLTHALDRLTRLLEQRLVQVDAIGIGLAQANELRRQNRLLEALPAEIASALELTLPALIAEAVGGRGGVGNDPTLLRGLVGEMQDNMSRASTRETAALAEILIEVRNALKGFSANVAQTGQEFGRQIDGAATTLQGQVSDSSRMLAETLSAVDQTALRLRTAAEPVARIADKFQVASTEISGAADRMAKTQGEMGQTLRVLNEATMTLKAFWTEYRTRFEEVDKGLAGAFVAFAEGSETHRKVTETFLREFDVELSKALTSLGGGVDELTTTVEDLKATVKDLALVLGHRAAGGRVAAAAS